MLFTGEDGYSTLYEEQGDDFTVTHFFNPRKVEAYVDAVRKENPTGFSEDRTREYVGTIPMWEIMRNPELNDPRKAYKWLQINKEYKLKQAPSRTFAGIIVK